MSMKQALISVSDKQGVVEFARGLRELGIGIISSGGTARALKENGIACREISELTGFPEILDGRVKTLNPKIHGGILARRDRPSHLEELARLDMETIDIVAVNLYPFEETIARLPDPSAGILTDEVIENIDIGGVTLLRAAAKNFTDVLVVSSPADYGTVLSTLKKGPVDMELRTALAAKAFRHTAYYDALISSYFTREQFPEEAALPLKRLAALRYGENPHQTAAFYRNGSVPSGAGIADAKQLQGKELSYNNYLDMESAWRLAGEFDSPACVIVKHNNPCGCAESDGLLDAYRKALACDPVSAYGGIIAVNRELDAATAEEIVKLFTECIVAPSYSEGARQVFAARKNLRLLELPAVPDGRTPPADKDYRTVSGGMLVQAKDALLSGDISCATERQPTDIERDSLLFAWKVCKHVKSNAIVLVRGRQTVGIGAGQMSRIDSLRIAVSKMNDADHGLNESDSPLVLASDAFFPFPDVVNESANVGVTAIIQPGGSIRDGESVKAAGNHGIAMLLTGMRHFRH